MDSQRRENHTSQCGDVRRDGRQGGSREAEPHQKGVAVGAEIDVVDFLVQALL